jgi:hypothetical protein
VVSVDGLLDAHEVSVRAKVDALREQVARVGAELSAAELALEHVSITRATLALVVTGTGPVLAATTQVQVPEGTVDRGPGVSLVPRWRADLTEAHLPAGYRRLWVLVRDAPTPPRVRELAASLGLEDTAAKREGVRSKLKRLVTRGWVREDAPGCFSVLACPAGGS